MAAFTVPDAVSFEQAIALSQSLLDQIEQGKLAETEIEPAIAALVASENGARGFFVTYLSDDRPFADPPTAAIIAALKTSPDVVSPLLVKNLAMSTAMAIAHRRNQNEDLAQGSDRVQSRSTQLIQALPSSQLQEQAQALAESIDTSTGAYQPFLQRWGYDPDQRQAIRRVLEQTGLLQMTNDE
ncbi:MAG: hypothetical protein HC866_26880 [Leptolyngbyaceae cyanobacterium RU_5_1]|nr:hypothetical protein [Leptolyngbyaceae cyanobacterium RU_5_1]